MVKVMNKKKHAGGRPTLYDPKYCKEIIDYFDIEPFEEREIINKKGKIEWTTYQQVAAPIRFLSAFARSINITTSTMDLWTKTHPEFSEAFKRAKQMQQEHMVICAAKGLFNASFTIFAMKNMHKWRDVQEVTHGGNIVFSTEEREKKLNGIRQELLITSGN